jgi:hypothetical protein
MTRKEAADILKAIWDRRQIDCNAMILAERGSHARQYFAGCVDTWDAILLNCKDYNPEYDPPDYEKPIIPRPPKEGKQ